MSPILAILLAVSPALTEPHVDRHGDPLPKDALLRIGTVRLRHAGSLMSLVFTPDGKTIISSAVQDSVRIWDAATGAPKGVLPQLMNGGVIGLALSPDGNTLAVCNPDCTVRFWDVKNHKPLAGCRGHTGPVRSCFFTPDGKTFITAGSDGGAPGDGTLRFWDAVTGGEQHQIKADNDWIFSAALSPDGKLIASSGEAHSIRLWDVSTRKEVRSIKLTNRCMKLAFSPDGKTLAAGEGAAVSIWDVATGRALRRIPVTGGRYSALTFSPDGRQLACADGLDVLLWDMKGKAPALRFEGHRETVVCLAFSPDGKTLASGGQDQTVRVWDVATGKERLLADEPAGVAVSAYLTPDGRHVVTAHKDHWIRVTDAASGRLVRRIGRADFLRTLARLQAMALSPDGKTIASSYDGDCAIILWDLATGVEKRRFALHGHMAFALAFTPDGRGLASAGYGDKVILWDTVTGKERGRYGEGADTFCSVSFSADGSLLLASGYDRQLHLYQVIDKTLRLVQRPPSKANGAAQLSPNGRLLLAVMGEQCSLTEAASGETLRSFESADAAAFTPNGRFLAAAGTDGKVHLQDVLGQKDLATIPGLSSRTRQLSISQDGKRLLTCGEDGTVLLWDVGRYLARPLPVELPTDKIDKQWGILGGPDALAAQQAVRQLATCPAAVPFLRERLHPVPKLDAVRVAALIRELENDDFETREKASRELARFGELAAPALREATKSSSPETRRRASDLLGPLGTWRYPLTKGEALRSIRAIETLEYSGTPDARRLLQALAGGAIEHPLTREAAAALRRLDRQ